MTRPRWRALLGAAFCLFLLTHGANVAAQPDESAPGTDEREMRALAEAWKTRYNAGDADGVTALYTEDAVRDDVPTGMSSDGRAAIEELAAALFASDDDVRLEVTDGFVGENWAVVEWTFSGVHPATGLEITFRGASVLEMTDGLISEERDYYDLPEMMAQIEGASATPAP